MHFKSASHLNSDLIHCSKYPFTLYKYPSEVSKNQETTQRRKVFFPVFSLRLCVFASLHGIQMFFALKLWLTIFNENQMTTSSMLKRLLMDS